MIIIAYILIMAAALVFVYFGHLQGTSQFYMSVFSAAIIGYCIYLDYKKRREKKEAENARTQKGQKPPVTSVSKSKKDTTHISQAARRSTKDKDLKR